MLQFFRSFINALKGVWQSVCIGRNLRIQIAAGVYVLLLSPFFLHTRAELALILIMISLVISLEIINTSIERLCDQTSGYYTPTIRFVKDAAAGGVLISAFCSVLVFVLLFFRKEQFEGLLTFCAKNLWYPILLIGLLVPFWFFIFWGPGFLLRKIKERKNKP